MSGEKTSLIRHILFSFCPTVDLSLHVSSLLKKRYFLQCCLHIIEYTHVDHSFSVNSFIDYTPLRQIHELVVGTQPFSSTLGRMFIFYLSPYVIRLYTPTSSSLKERLTERKEFFILSSGRRLYSSSLNSLSH